MNRELVFCVRKEHLTQIQIEKNVLLHHEKAIKDLQCCFTAELFNDPSNLIAVTN